MLSEYVACAGGPLGGQWFTREDWDIRVLAAERTSVGPAPLYTPTERRIQNPHQEDPKKKHLHDIEAQVYEWRS